MALLWEVLTGVLGGLAFGPNVGALEDLSRPQEVSHFLLALDPAAYLPLDLFTARIDSLIEQIRGVPPPPVSSGRTRPASRASREPPPVSARASHSRPAARKS